MQSVEPLVTLMKWITQNIGVRMTPEIKFKRSNLQPTSSGIGITPEPKFRELNLQFVSSGTRMTHRDKLEDR